MVENKILALTSSEMCLRIKFLLRESHVLDLPVVVGVAQLPDTWSDKRVG